MKVWSDSFGGRATPDNFPDDIDLTLERGDQPSMTFYLKVYTENYNG